jgi:hypothetical protein
VGGQAYCACAGKYWSRAAKGSGLRSNSHARRQRLPADGGGRGHAAWWRRRGRRLALSTMMPYPGWQEACLR